MKGLDQPPFSDRSAFPSLFSIRRDLCSLTLQAGALTEYPERITLARDASSAEVIGHAQELFAEIGSIGPYSIQLLGRPFHRRVHRKVHRRYENSRTTQSTTNPRSERDGYHFNPDYVFPTAGPVVHTLAKLVTPNHPPFRNLDPHPPTPTLYPHLDPIFRYTLTLLPDSAPF